MVDYLSVSINVFHSLKAVTMQRGKLNISQFFSVFLVGGGGGRGLAYGCSLFKNLSFFKKKMKWQGVLAFINFSRL